MSEDKRYSSRSSFGQNHFPVNCETTKGNLYLWYRVIGIRVNGFIHPISGRVTYVVIPT